MVSIHYIEVKLSEDCILLMQQHGLKTYKALSVLVKGQKVLTGRGFGVVSELIGDDIAKVKSLPIDFTIEVDNQLEISDRRCLNLGISWWGEKPGTRHVEVPKLNKHGAMEIVKGFYDLWSKDREAFLSSPPTDIRRVSDKERLTASEIVSLGGLVVTIEGDKQCQKVM